MHISGDAGVWIQAFLILALLSFLYKDNPVYKFAEHIFVGVSAGYGMALMFHKQIMDDMIKKVFPASFGSTAPPELTLIGGGILGFVILCRLIPGVSWISRWGIALVVGFNAGIQIFASLSAYVLKQMYATMIPLLVPADPATTVKGLLIVAGVLSIICYFYFSKEHTGWYGGIARVGIWILMITFGFGYGATVMTRISIVMTPFQILLKDWLGVMK